MSQKLYPLLVTLLQLIIVQGKQYCQPTEPCWPTLAQLEELNNSLNPEMERKLIQDPNIPKISPVPYGSPNDQPLYGLGTLKALYVATTDDNIGTCFVDNFITEFCLASTRNVPYEGLEPKFIVWPLTVSHVQIAVKFATQHNLCISVAGTGHDFLNRHTCLNGFFIRTSLMKNIEWDLNDSKGFGHQDGNVKFGAGIVFAEAHKSAADNNRFVSSGWASTVGIIGWSIGGGHGPFTPSKGLGVDNILEVELVDANGNVFIANAKSNTDLYWALRGGGGSTWGIITAITVRAHQIPVSGIQYISATWSGSSCANSLKRRDALIDNIEKQVTKLNYQWGGLVHIQPTAANKIIYCGAKWSFYLQYVYLGWDFDLVFQDFIQSFINIAKPDQQAIVKYNNWYEKVKTQDLEYLLPIQNIFGPNSNYVGGIPSVLVSKENVLNGKLFSKIKEMLEVCRLQGRCNRQEVYHITGNIDSPQNDFVSISPGMRTALLHYVGGGLNPTETDSIYQLGENSYFSESAFSNYLQFTSRYWGSTNTLKLQDIKKKYDPKEVFSCRHCISINQVNDHENSF